MFMKSCSEKYVHPFHDEEFPNLNNSSFNGSSVCIKILWGEKNNLIMGVTVLQ